MLTTQVYYFLKIFLILFPIFEPSIFPPELEAKSTNILPLFICIIVLDSISKGAFFPENKTFDIEAKDELLLKTTLVKNGNKTENFYDG